MTDEELIARLRGDMPEMRPNRGLGWREDIDLVAVEVERKEAADRIEALVKEVKDERAAKFKMRDERDAAKIAASNYADFNHTWRKRAERLEAAMAQMRDDKTAFRHAVHFRRFITAALKGEDHD